MSRTGLGVLAVVVATLGACSMAAQRVEPSPAPLALADEPLRPAALRIRDTAVRLEWRGGVALVALDPVVRLAGGSSRVVEGGRLEVALGRARLEVMVGLPVARAGAAMYPLAGVPDRRDAEVLVPLQVFSELMPRLDTSVLFRRDRTELLVRPPARVVAEAAPPPRPLPPAAALPSRPPVAASGSRPPAAASGSDRSAPERSAPERSAPVPRSARRIVIDPGHGGTDPGMRGRLPDGRVVWEKDITLGVARALATALREEGREVILTRERDTLIALDDRGRIANARRGDLFLSIHVNAANPQWRNADGARGFETYFLAEAKTEDARRVAAMENEVVRFETPAAPGARDPLSFIVNDMAQNEHLRESSELAAAIQDALARRHPGPNRGVKQAEFRVLVRAFMPAVLIEIGFGSNPAEAAWMTSPAGQRAIAASIADATRSYLDAYERRVGGSGGS